MTLTELGIPPFRRKVKGRPKPPKITPPDVAYRGSQVAEFVDDVLSKNRHFTADHLAELRSASKIIGTTKPDASKYDIEQKAVVHGPQGKLIGVMYGRHWYVQ